MRVCGFDERPAALTVKERDERYDFIHNRAVPEIPNAEERRLMRIEWSIVSKAAEMSKRHKQETC